MTIVAWDGKGMAADKMAVSGSYKGGIVTKIHRWSGGLCGISGEMDVGVQLIDWLQSGMNPNEFPELQNVGEAQTSFLVVFNDGRLATFERTPIPLWLEEKFCAIGSGREYALAAMHLGKSAVDAAKLACELDVYCGNGIDYLELN